MSKFTDELFDMAFTTSKGLVTGEPHNPVRTPWREVHLAARRMAGALELAGVGRSQTVAILAGEPYDIAPLTQAVWLRGARFTMLHQPTPRTNLETWMADTAKVLAMIDAAVVVVGAPFLPAAQVLEQQGFTVLDVRHMTADFDIDRVDPADDDIAMLQLTSGTTGTPKAIAISHRNLYQNHHAMIEASHGDRDTDVTVSWLPLFHDMGMVGFLIEPMVGGGEAVCVTPTEFLKSPLLWAQLITQYRGTMTAAPNFAYSVLARRLRNAPDGAYDLSSLRFVLNGAEPIDVSTIDLLLDSGRRFGLAPSAMIAAYGMAEATLAVSFSQLAEPIRVDPVDTDALEVDRVARPGAGERSRNMVTLGPALPGMDVRVVDESRIPVAARHVGEIEIRSDAVTRAYLTPAGFEPAVDADGWLRTGDLGYLLENGEVVVSGRKKDLIIIAGRNLAPTDIEKAAGTVDGVRSGNAAAVRITREGSREDFAVIVESGQADDEAERSRIESEVSRAVFDHIGVGPRLVLVVKQGDLPKTPSGKIRRTAAQELLVSITAETSV
jgi:fatty-acyl-CoA synthase